MICASQRACLVADFAADFADFSLKQTNSDLQNLTCGRTIKAVKAGALPVHR